MTGSQPQGRELSTRRDRSLGYPLAIDTLTAVEINAAKAVLDSGQLTMGAKVREFEGAFAAWTGAKHAVMVNSGSSANLLVVDALVRTSTKRQALVAGDEVLVPGLAWPTTVWPIAQMGLVPAFVDVDPLTLGMDLESAESMLSPRTRAMFIIHPLGRALEMADYHAFCERHGLILIEDCCESLGAHFDASHVGTTSLMGSFSFYFSHHVSTIEGGMIVTNDDATADDLRGLRAHGWVRDRSDRQDWVDRFPDLDPRFLFATVGYNVRPTEIPAAIGLVQLTRLDEMLAARERLAGQVAEWLRACTPWLHLIGSDALDAGAWPARREQRRHSWMTLPMRLDTDSPINRAAVVDHFERNGVETRALIAGNLARHPGVGQVNHRKPDAMPACDALLSDTLMIGCHPVLEDGHIDALASAITSLQDIASR